MFFLALDVLGVAAIIAILWTQIISTKIKGINIFPYFNDKLNDAQTAVVVERENLEIATLQNEAVELRKQIDDLTSK